MSNLHTPLSCLPAKTFYAFSAVTLSTRHTFQRTLNVHFSCCGGGSRQAFCGESKIALEPTSGPTVYVILSFGSFHFLIETPSLWNGPCGWQVPSHWRCWRLCSAAWCCSDHRLGVIVWPGPATTGTPSTVTTSDNCCTTFLLTR